MQGSVGTATNHCYQAAAATQLFARIIADLNGVAKIAGLSKNSLDSFREESD